MSINLKEKTNAEDTGSYIVSAILEKLSQGKKVLWLVTGGSSIKVASIASKNIASKAHNNLTIMLTDERYGNVGHKDSNWQKLLEAGFALPEANFIPILNGDNLETTTDAFAHNLKKEFSQADFKIGIFGVGADGHTAGILPNSPAIKTDKLAFSYTGPDFERITITPQGISLLDEVVIFMQGEEKWKVAEDLLNTEISLEKQPAQILKSIAKATLFTDYKN